jgi:ethanolamine utilization protein EutA
VTYRSPICFTPFKGGSIDTKKLQSFLTSVYSDANLTPDDVDTGAVIITGFAARRENAEAIVKLFSAWAGKFVCATAGPNLETVLSAHGSGAVAMSRTSGKTIMNVDIGGGTSKIAIIENGRIIDTSSVRIGARVVGITSNNVVTRIDEPAALACAELGMNLRLGDTISTDNQQSIVDLLTDSLFELIARRRISNFTKRLLETHSLSYTGNVDAIVFSGGVSEYIYEGETREFGDLGFRFGQKIRERTTKLEEKLLTPSERIRATVMGASQHSLQVSGNTIFISETTILPLRNLQVLKVRLDDAEPTAADVTMAVREAMSRHDVDQYILGSSIALAIHLQPGTSPTSELVRNIASGIALAWNESFRFVTALVLIFDLDIARLVGSWFFEHNGGRIVCIDGITIEDFDYVDIGHEIEYSQTVPVVLKNLVFVNDADSLPDH